MGKISVFKFKMNGADESEIKAIIESYLASRGFSYDAEAHAYSTGTPTKEETAKNIAKGVGVSLVSAALGGTFGHVYSKVDHRMEYQLNGVELIIKAYLYVKGKKIFIHSMFNNSAAASNYYSDLKMSLFKALEEKGVEQTAKEVEKE